MHATKMASNQGSRIYDRERGREREAGMEAAKRMGIIARGNARGSSPYSNLKPATASAKLLTLRCAHMTRSTARDAHPVAC